ncbi:MAG: TldD/PmbA family protein [bacterium]
MKSEEEMNERKKIKQFTDRVLKLSDADSTLITVQYASGGLTRFSGNEITQNVASREFPFTIRVNYGGKIGKASGTSLKKENIENYLKRAKDTAMHSKKKKDELPPAKKKKYKKTGTFSRQTADIPPAEKAKKVKYAVGKCASAGLEGAGIISSGMNAMCVANSAGLFAMHKMSDAKYSLSAIGKTGSGWSEDIKSNFKDIDFKNKTGAAIAKARLAEKPKEVKPGRYTVILEPAAVADLISFMAYGVFNTRAYIEGRSFLKGKKGKKIVSEKITVEDNAYMEGMNGIPFDFEGFPRKKVTLLKNGVFKNLIHNRQTAKTLKAENTGHSLGPDDTWGPIPLNLHIHAGSDTLDNMIQTTEKGILVTHFHYVNMLNPMTTTITGMTRNGTFLVEKGKIKTGVKNFRFTQSIIEALSNVVMLGDTEELHSGGFWGGFYVPAMKIDNFNFTSITDF